MEKILSDEQLKKLVLKETGAKIYSDYSQTTFDIMFEQIETADGYEIYGKLDGKGQNFYCMWGDSIFYYADDRWIEEIVEAIKDGNSIHVYETDWIDSIDWVELAREYDIEQCYYTDDEGEKETYEELLERLK